MPAIQPVCSSEPLQTSVPNFSSKSSVSTLSDEMSSVGSVSTSFEPSKPVLEPPSFNRNGRLAEYAVLKSIDNINTAGSGLLKLNMDGLDDCHEKLKEIQAENSKKLTEAARRSQQNNVWTLLKKIGGVILAAVSTVLGVALISSGAGTLIGGAMIASGILTIANLAFIETGVWDWIAEKLVHENQEKQKRLAVLFPTVVGLVCAVVGLAGSSGAILWTSLNIGEKILIFFQTALSMTQGLISIGEGVTKYRSLQTQADLVSIKQKLFTNQNAIEKFTGGVERFMRHQNHVLDEVKKIIKLSINANRAVLQA
jgi:hypothetical protein